MPWRVGRGRRLRSGQAQPWGGGGEQAQPWGWGGAGPAVGQGSRAASVSAKLKARTPWLTLKGLP